MTAREIIENKAGIYACAKAFRQDANRLMIQLSQTFNFDIHECGAWPAYVYETGYNKKGILDSEWTFYLHGSHCHFENLVNGQTIEVRYTEKPEFGCLDGFFLYTYMLTTTEFKDLATWFSGHANVYKAIEVLAAEGILTVKKDSLSSRYIIAL